MRILDSKFNYEYFDCLSLDYLKFYQDKKGINTFGAKYAWA